MEEDGEMSGCKSSEHAEYNYTCVCKCVIVLGDLIWVILIFLQGHYFSPAREKVP